MSRWSPCVWYWGLGLVLGLLAFLLAWPIAGDPVSASKVGLGLAAVFGVLGATELL